MSASPFEGLHAAKRGEPVALLHSCGQGPAWLFEEPIELLSIGIGIDELPGAFERIGAFLDRHGDDACVGFLGYDLRDAVEELPRLIEGDALGTPAVWLGAFARRREWLQSERPQLVEAGRAEGLHAHLPRQEYERRVARVVEHIRAGDIFQANLTQPFSGRFEGDPRLLFERLCAVSPAPFAAYIETGDGLSILSASPEEFLRMEGRRVQTMPIKGTRRRGTGSREDAALLAELLASQKDLAELAMIVDLLRNDLGKVAKIGSVMVGPFPEHDSFAQVHHLFATVVATLRDDVDVAELLRATFPGGSITGAPKLRCMEILEELELVRRGVYTGSVGWFGPGPRLHLNVAIRTMTWRGGEVRFNAGGGVTADSDPGLEYEETLHKAEGMLRALGVAASELEVRES